ncbi:Protein HUA2-LIKE 3 [Cardamine amara subsp. amara]|uniref:Protein HUA2-LIKE 3 n=1 Tax=Cardamine amara subsp. amara TaxID=228776 RepID=A0ABD1A2B9_CARAN
MAPSRKKGGGKAAAARREWKVGDLVLAKVKGFPAWPAAVSEPEKWGYSADSKKVLVHFFGTQQIAFCNPADVESFTEEKKQSLLTKRHAKGSDFVRAIKEITESYEKMKQQDQASDPKSVEDTTAGSSGNTLQLPQACENLIDTRLDTQMKSSSSHDIDESTLLSEDASAAEQMLALRHNTVAHNGAFDSAAAKDLCEIATYSSRRRNESSRSQKYAPQKIISPVQHSKISSRLELDRLQSSDGGQNVDGIDDRAIKRRKRVQRSSHSESDDVVSEENASEIATVESDSNSRNEGNVVDSESKIEHSDAVGESCDGGHELNKGLDFQISTRVKRKKRKPTRKRETSDVIDPPAKVEAEVVLGGNACDSCQRSQSSDERPNEKPCEENGDEHLPLVKRARVRMSRAFYANEKVNAPSQSEERSSKDTLISAVMQIGPAVNPENDIVSSHDTSAAEEFNSSELSAMVPGVMVDVVTSHMEKPSDGMSPTRAYVQILGDRKTAMEFHENELSITPYDDVVTRAQSNQLSGSPEGKTHVLKVVLGCSEESQTQNGLNSEFDPIDMQCSRQTDKADQLSGSPEGKTQVPKVVPGCSEESQTRNGVNSESDPIDMQCSRQTEKADQLSGSPEGKTQVPKVVPGCSVEWQTRNGLNSESDPIDMQCSRQTEKGKTCLNPDTVDSSANNSPGLCLSADMTASQEPAQSSLQHQSQDYDSCDHSFVSVGDSLNEKCEKIDYVMTQVVQSQAVEHSPLFCSVVNFQEAENMQETESTLLKKEQGSPDKEFDCDKQATESDMIVEEAEPQYETGNSHCENAVENRGLEKSCEADEQKEQMQAIKSVSVSENLSRERLSLSSADVSASPARDTPNSSSVFHISTAESENGMPNNSNCSTNVQFGEKKSLSDDTVKQGRRVETGVTQVKKVGSSDVKFTIESFETALGSLVRTKETIGRATRLAMDFVKFGASAKAMEILAHTLESESNLKRRVDLFFLVDSIAQCSKGRNGDAGGVYLSSIQAMLPRLLAAAAPAGATTQENREHCLKVLRLWLERRILPESIVLHHIRELDSLTNVPACLYSRRSARTERALDDPVRDMEGMLLDEYGSNSTLQLHGFCMPAMLEDDDVGSDSDGGDFESVTPEHESRILEEHVTPSVTERHTRILEDVDGELEMEDVAPPWEAGSSVITQADNTESANCHPVYGTSRQNVTSSSPPAPSSQKCAMSDSYSNGFNCSRYPSMNGDHQAGPSRMNPPMHYRSPEPSYSSRVSLSKSMPCGENSNFQHRPYPSSHPPPPPSHQYSYMEPKHHIKSRREGPPRPHRSHYTQDYDERNYYDSHERMRPAPPVNRDNWKYHPPSSHGPQYHDRHKGPYESSSYSGHHRDSGRFQNQRWSNSPRAYSNGHSFQNKPYSEGPVPVGMRGNG